LLTPFSAVENSALFGLRASLSSGWVFAGVVELGWIALGWVVVGCVAVG
jgi:hypothetical protein